MFWGLIMEPKRRYTQTVKRPFHISMAALDIFSADAAPTQVMLYFEERNYLLCTLQKGEMLQCPLDLNFEIGDKVIFATNGNSNIHLSGYLQDQFDELSDEEGLEDEMEEEEVEEDTKSRKKKLEEKNMKKEPPSKKSKLTELLQDEYDSDDEDESFVLSEALENDEGDSDEEEEEQDEDDIEDDDDDKDDEDKSDASSLSEEEEEIKTAAQMNGDKPKSQKKKQQNSHQEANVKNKKKFKQETSSEEDTLQKTPKNSKFGESPSQLQKKTLEGGVIIQDLKVGNGIPAKPGKMVQVYYEGRLKQNNKLFDQANKGVGFKFRLGKQEVIRGWDIGVAGMKVGGRRRIICPPAMAYGQKGSPPAIPPNSTLVFEVELKNIA